MDSLTLTSYLKLLACDRVGVLSARKLLDLSKDVDSVFNVGNKQFFEDFNIPKSIQNALFQFVRVRQ